jgi:hypothetical protein
MGWLPGCGKRVWLITQTNKEIVIPMIVTTLRSVYQIRRDRGLFRRINGVTAEGASALGTWRTFEQMGPVAIGRPLRFFFSLAGGRRQLSKIQTLTTSPVVKVVDDGAALDPHEAALLETGGGPQGR